MSEQKSEVQNLDGPTEATEPLDATPAALDTGHVGHGEPKNYGGDEPTALDQARDGEGYPSEERRDRR